MATRKATKKGGKGSTSGGQTEVDLSDLITQKEAAEIRGVTVAAISDLVKRGRLRGFEQFGKTLVSRSEVTALEDKRGWPKGKPRKEE